MEASTRGQLDIACRACIQLEEAVAVSLKQDEPGIVLGLSASGIRNRARQKEERQLKAKSDLEKHQRSFHKPPMHSNDIE